MDRTQLHMSIASTCELLHMQLFFSETDWITVPTLRSGVMQMVFINKCKSCEISNQMFFNVMFSFLENKSV